MTILERVILAMDANVSIAQYAGLAIENIFAPDTFGGV